jgi:hypothetical protein
MMFTVLVIFIKFRKGKWRFGLFIKKIEVFN